MNFNKLILTNNHCYVTGVKHTPVGIFVHSTGANNPYLKRYVGPDDGKLGVNKYNNHWNQKYPEGRSICVHAFIGKLEDGSVATYQTLPFDMVGWHSGAGTKGNANFMGYLGFEICEDGLDDKDYFDKVYKEAVEFCISLCGMYPTIKIENIIGHYEGHERGIASNHGDPKHWFSRFGKSMDTFRADVKKGLDSIKPDVVKTDDVKPDDVLYTVQAGAFKNKANAQEYLKKIQAAGFKDAFIKEC